VIPVDFIAPTEQAQARLSPGSDTDPEDQDIIAGLVALSGGESMAAGYARLLAGTRTCFAQPMHIAGLV